MRSIISLFICMFFMVFATATYVNATIISVSTTNTWVNLPDQDVGGDGKGGIILEFMNDTGGDIKDFHIQLREAENIFNFAKGSILPFTTFSVTQGGATANYAGGTLGNGSSVSFALQIKTDHDGIGETPKIHLVGKAKMRYMATTDGDLSHVPSPGALPLMLAGLAVFGVFVRFCHRKGSH